MRKLIGLFVLLCFAGLQICFAQTREITGTVVDKKDRTPLPGVSVVVKGNPSTGVATDINGKFTLKVNDEDVLVFSFIGMKPQEVAVKGKTHINVELEPASEALDEVVVVAYGTAKKESLTGSVAVVGAKEIEERPVTSVTAALEGNAPGVQVTSATLQPGQSPAIRIRGFSSINGNNNALIIVDGSEYVGDIAAINPLDIESMSVLKDAASCALYGNRGANGVVLITTKKAKNIGKIDVTLQVRQGIYERALPMYERQTAEEWTQSTFDAQVNGAMTGQKLSKADAIDLWRNTYIDSYAQINIFNKPKGEVFDANGRLAAQVLPGYTGDDMNWWKGVSKTGNREEYNVSMAGATEKFNIFASAGYLNESGYVRLTDYERFSGRVNIGANPVSFLRLGLNLSAAQQEMQRSPVNADGLGYTNNPFSMTQNKAPIYPYYLHDSKGNIVYDNNGKPVWNQEKYNTDGNIVWQIREDRRNFSVSQFDASLYATVVLPYGFEATVKGLMFRDKTNELEYNNNKIGSQANVGSLSQGFYRTGTHTFQQSLTWAKDYGIHHVDVLLSHENYQYLYDENFIRKSGQELEGLIHMSNFSEMKDMNAYSTKFRLESYLGRARYNYDQKYFVEASIRRDGTSRFAKDDRWGTFWSVGGSWVISKEQFMLGLPVINYLKFRTAYGVVGNDASAGHYASWGIYNFGWAVGGNVSSLVPSQLAPSGLRWESTKTLDIALEGTLFNNRLNFSVGYYNKRNSDLLFWRNAAPSSGGLGNTITAPEVLQNIGTMENVGWEIQLSGDVVRTKDFRWNLGFDASFLKNKIRSLPDNQDIPGQSLFVGKSLYEMYTYEFAGIDQTNGRSLYLIDPHSPDYYTYDANNKRVYQPDDYITDLKSAAAAGQLIEIDGKYYTYNTSNASRKIFGTSLPTVFGSFNSSFSWKNLNVGLLFQYSLGGKTYDSNYASLVSVGPTAGNALHKDILNSWTQKPAGVAEHEQVTSTINYVDAEGNEQSVTINNVLRAQSNAVDPNGIPQLNSVNSSYSNSSSSRFLLKNDYIIFKNVNVSYDFPKHWVNTIKLQALNLGVSIDNVFIGAKRKGLSPQYNFSGGQGQYFVPARVYSVSLTAKF